MALPKLDKDQKVAMAQAIKDGMSPVIKELDKLVVSVDAAMSNRGETKVSAAERAIEKLGSAIGRGLLFVLPEKQAESLKSALMKTQGPDTSSMLTDKMMQDLVDNIEKLVAITALSAIDKKRADAELLRLERDRDRENSRSKSEARSRRSTVESKVEVPSLREGFSIIGMIGGLIGLVSMIPAKFREFIDEYVVAISATKALIIGKLMAPILSILGEIPILGKILSGLPILGTILGKMPILSVILAAFEVLPKVFERYKTDGWWGALEEGLQGLYKFFITDVSVLGGKLMNWITKKLFGEEVANALDFEAWARTFGDGFSKVITDFVSLFQTMWTGTAEEQNEATKRMFFSLVDSVANGLLALFKLPTDFSSEDFFTDLVSQVSRIANEYLSDAAIETFFAGIVDSTKNLTSGIAKSIDDWLRAYLSDAAIISLAGSVWSATVDAVMKSMTAALEINLQINDAVIGYVKGVANSWMISVSAAFNEAIQQGLNIKDDILNWMASIWESMKAALTPDFSGFSLSSVKDMFTGGSESQVTLPPTKGLLQEQEIVKKTMAFGRDQVHRRPAPTVISNKTSSVNQTSNFSVSGMSKASNLDPLSASVGGSRGSGW